MRRNANPLTYVFIHAGTFILHSHGVPIPPESASEDARAASRRQTSPDTSIDVEQTQADGRPITATRVPCVIAIQDG